MRKKFLLFFGEDMNNKILEKEKKYLSTVHKVIDENYEKSQSTYTDNLKQIQNYKKYFAENFYEINKDGGEIAEINLQIESLEQNNIALTKLVNRLKKQKKSPFFGKFDFKADNEKEPTSYYIGIGHLQNEMHDNLVYDWRADISSLYYDDVLGRTSYTCPSGEIEGELTLKRQFKIEQGNMRY